MYVQGRYRYAQGSYTGHHNPITGKEGLFFLCLAARFQLGAGWIFPGSMAHCVFSVNKKGLSESLCKNIIFRDTEFGT